MTGAAKCHRPHAAVTILLLITAVIFSFTGCTSPTSTLQQQGTTAPIAVVLTPQEAIFAAANRPAGVSGLFRMTVLGTGRKDGYLYLNSEFDYRDQRCLTLELTNNVDRDLRNKLAGDPTVSLLGKEVIVAGNARQVKVWLYFQGLKSTKYYYQTHIRVSDLSQLLIFSPRHT
ncbi:MAG: hypothetical protein JSS11_14710 [Verrucomicrobia bacterium]|nr:hypothetical protein [Verrucomicrobiota bacterium]